MDVESKLKELGFKEMTSRVRTWDGIKETLFIKGKYQIILSLK